MPVIRACSHCETKNRIPAKHLSDTARCGACKESLPPLAKPLAADVALFDEIVQNLLSQSWSTSGLAGAARVAWPLLRWQRQPWRQLVMLSSSGIPNFAVFFGGKLVRQEAGLVDHSVMSGRLRAAS